MRSQQFQQIENPGHTWGSLESFPIETLIARGDFQFFFYKMLSPIGYEKAGCFNLLLFSVED
jgi:hypothetical protein